MARVRVAGARMCETNYFWHACEKGGGGGVCVCVCVGGGGQQQQHVLLQHRAILTDQVNARQR